MLKEIKHIFYVATFKIFTIMNLFYYTFLLSLKFIIVTIRVETEMTSNETYQ